MRPRLTYANVVSTVCLFLILGSGAAYAANTVFSGDIVDGEVKTSDIATAAVGTDKIAQGAVTSEKVRNDNLTGGDVLANSLRGADIDESTLSSVGGGGPAGGDLTGTYPNPQIRAHTVSAGELASDAFIAGEIGRDVNTSQFEIRTGAIQRDEMASNSVASQELPRPLQRPGLPVTIDGGESANGDWGSGQASASCNPGEDLLFGLGEWLDNSAGEELAIVEVRVDYVQDTVAAVGISDSGAEEFRAVAVCMPP
jgi:hypothetical protein